jgi:hypothetical protein
MLRLELGDLKELGFDLTLTGFDEVQLGAFLADKTEGLTDPDDAPALESDRDSCRQGKRKTLAPPASW